jgi:uncharacterized protein (TIGR03437 family)
LVFALVSAVFAGGGGPSEEENCIGARIIKDSGLAYYCLFVARAFTNINSNQPQATSAALAFETNLGQADRKFQYLAHSAGGSVYLAKGGVTLDLQDSKRGPRAVRAAFAGANANPEAVLEDPLPGHVNYLLGKSPEGWITDVPTFARVRYRELYPGIDVVYYGAQGVLEHDMVVHPGADPAKVAMQFDGADEVTLDSSGAAMLHAGGHTVEWKKPVLYQEVDGRRMPVEGRYRKTAGGELGFDVGNYDRSRALVIDPVVTYASYEGHGSAEGGSRVAVDRQGNTYVAGYSRDSAFAVTPGAYTPGTGLGNQGNGFVIKYNATNSAVVFTTYVGGASWDMFSSLAVDPNGNVFLAGVTDSDDYPVTTGALKTKLHTVASDVTTDCTVTKLNAAGNGLGYSTYLGGPGNDGCAGIAVDGQGNAYLTGFTADSFGFPLGDNAPYRLPRGPLDAFVVKLNPTGTAVVHGTLLGGNDVDSGMAIAIDAAGAAYITGQTTSFNFPVTTGVVQRTIAAVQANPTARFGDAFVAKLSPDGGTFQYVTYLGGKGEDLGWAIAVDSSGNAYVAGQTISSDFPVTSGALQPTYKGLGGNAYLPGGDGFVAKINPTGTALSYSTYLGGTKDDWATSIAVDGSGNAWVAGATLSSDFPITADAGQKAFGGARAGATFPTGDAWIVELSPTGSAEVYGTYLGGKGDEFALGVALDAAGNAYFTGSTLSSDFPVTANALQKGYGGTDYNFIPLGDTFLVKVSLAALPPPPVQPSVSVSSVGSAASYAGGGVAPGEIVVLTGVNIGPATLTTGSIAASKFGTQIGNTQVLFDGQAAPLLYASGGQTSAIVPYTVAGRAATQLVVVNNGERSTALPLTVLPAHPALFSANASGRGQGAILNEDYSYNSPSIPAAKGHYVLLYGTGEGPTSPTGVDGLLALVNYPKPVVPVTVTIGGLPAEVAYYGAAPQAVAGLLQVNAKVPDGVPSGNAEVVIQIGTAKSQTGLTVAVQ